MRSRKIGRRLLGIAASLSLLAVAGWVAQLFLFGSTTVPWYVPILAVAATILALVAFAKAPGILRGITASMIVAVGSILALFVIRGSLLPRYEGPARAGTPFPAFAAQRASGESFTSKELVGEPTIVVFFRGRW